MSSGDNMTRDEGIAVVPKWNEEADTLDSFEKRVKLYVTSTPKEDRSADREHWRRWTQRDSRTQ